MLFTSIETIDECVIRLLSKRGSTSSSLFDDIRKENKNISIQALYKAMRSLINLGVVVKSGVEVKLSREWTDKIKEVFTDSSALPILANGEVVTYKYNSLANLDAYWKHLMKSFETELPDFPVFLYSPFHIWYHISDRTQSEAEFFSSFTKNKHYGFFVIGNNTKIDQQFKKLFHSDYMQIDVRKSIALNENDYLTIIDDYVIHTILNKNMTSAIKKYYLSENSEEAKVNLKEFLARPNKSKIKIERNANKARQLRKKLFKNFYLPKEVKEQYDLF